MKINELGQGNPSLTSFSRWPPVGPGVLRIRAGTWEVTSPSSLFNKLLIGNYFSLHVFPKMWRYRLVENSRYLRIYDLSICVTQLFIHTWTVKIPSPLSRPQLYFILPGQTQGD
jgi:hypothetical protein